MWIAADAFIGPGVTIGEDAVIGVRSVVLKDMPKGMVCVGHPCVPLKPRCLQTVPGMQGHRPILPFIIVSCEWRYTPAI